MGVDLKSQQIADVFRGESPVVVPFVCASNGSISGRTYELLVSPTPGGAHVPGLAVAVADAGGDASPGRVRASFSAAGLAARLYHWAFGGRTGRPASCRPRG